MFGLSPYEEMRKNSINMATNYACYLALIVSENEEYQKAQEKGEHEALAFGRYLDQLNQQSKTARS